VKHSRGPADNGFTLIEVMIAMFILSFIVGGLATISIHASRSTTYAQRLSRAILIAEDALEVCRNTAFESLTTAWTGESCTTAAPVTTCTDTGSPPFTRIRTVEWKNTDAEHSFTAAVHVEPLTFEAIPLAVRNYT